MNLTDTIKATPIQTDKSIRTEEVRAITSGDAGKSLPLAVFPVLREDRANGKLRIKFEMGETAQTLLNAINVTVRVDFVPYLAFERFNGLDQLNRSYSGIPETDGGAVVPFFETVTFRRDAEFWNTLGMHFPEDSEVNSAPVEAYNALINFRRKARSTKLPLRSKTDRTLARAFWKNSAFNNIVPDFDQAMIDGEVDLNLAAMRLPVKGLGIKGSDSASTKTGVSETGETATRDYTGWQTNDSNMDFFIEQEAGNAGFPAIYAELAEKGITLSLSNIEMAKQTAAFAALRKRFAGHDDDYIIDLLMSGVRVPDAQMAQPILLDRKSTLIGYNRRYATDAANLDKSVTTGETYVDLRFRTPALNTGGVILVTAEIVPEQLFERQYDFWLGETNVAKYPEFTRDFLDPEKVDIVPNKFVDVEHSDPDGTFGYAPLNHHWNRNIPRVGGKFYRQLGDPFVEDRQRIWSVETVDPALTEDFYLVNELPKTVFADQNVHSFEITTIGGVQFIGNTVFGKGLQEDTGDYEALMADNDTSRIDQTA